MTFSFPAMFLMRRVVRAAPGPVGGGSRRGVWNAAVTAAGRRRYVPLELHQQQHGGNLFRRQSAAGNQLVDPYGIETHGVEESLVLVIEMRFR